MEGDDVIIKADKKLLAKPRRTKATVLAASDEDKRTFLIVGGGEEGDGGRGVRVHGLRWFIHVLDVI